MILPGNKKDKLGWLDHPITRALKAEVLRRRYQALMEQAGHTEAGEAAKAQVQVGVIKTLTEVASVLEAAEGEFSETPRQVAYQTTMDDDEPFTDPAMIAGG